AYRLPPGRVSSVKGQGPRSRTASGIFVVAFAVSCSAAPLAASDASQTAANPTPTAAAAIVPIPTASVPPTNSCTSANGLPDRKCTPGATNPDVTQATVGITICVSGYVAQIRPPATYTNGLKIDD